MTTTMTRAKSGAKSVPARSRSALVSGAQRERMIAEAAYFRAAHRGFVGGDPIEDWLAAEREIDRALPGPKQQKEEALVYDKLRRGVADILADVQDVVKPETMRQAFDRAAEELRKNGAHTAETISRIVASLRKDMANAAAGMGPRWESFSEKSAGLFGVWRDRSSAFLGQAAEAVGDWLQQTSTRISPPTYRAGEMAAAGTFACTLCGERVTLSMPGHLPACPKCGKLEFRRI